MKRFAVLVTLALAGCAAIEPLVTPVDAIVAEAVTAARAPAAEQSAALARAQQAGVTAPTDRLRLATLLATLPPPLRDDPRAMELLEPIADASAPGVGRFAALLSSQIMERQRLARELDRLNREAANAARERERLEKAREGLDKERDKREEALKQQLDALRAIERGILEREEKLRRKQK
jgi:septal ring factor EnvC (AmiA/AmiB activator)